MTYSPHAHMQKHRGQASVGSNDRVETNGRTRPIALPCPKSLDGPVPASVDAARRRQGSCGSIPTPRRPLRNEHATARTVQRAHCSTVGGVTIGLATTRGNRRRKCEKWTCSECFEDSHAAEADATRRFMVQFSNFQSATVFIYYNGF